MKLKMNLNAKKVPIDIFLCKTCVFVGAIRKTVCLCVPACLLSIEFTKLSTFPQQNTNVKKNSPPHPPPKPTTTATNTANNPTLQKQHSYNV